MRLKFEVVVNTHGDLSLNAQRSLAENIELVLNEEFDEEFSDCEVFLIEDDN